jgi:hypothetical protein
MHTSGQCGAEWARGYKDGWRVYKNSTPGVPGIPPLPSGITDDLKWYYDAGYAAGKAAALKEAAGI